jgi:aerobic carbon-monoxide dehydrogenase small subunit
MRISFRLNGDDVTVNVPPETSLVHTLRTHFGIRSVGRGCGRGECGTCAVLLNDSVVYACLIPVFAVRDNAVLTVEGFSGSHEYQLIMSAMEAAGITPCPSCLPGVLFGLYELMNTTTHPKDTDIFDALKPHLFHCIPFSIAAQMVKRIELSWGRRR